MGLHTAPEWKTWYQDGDSCPGRYVHQCRASESSLAQRSAPNLSHGYNQSFHAGGSHLPWTQQEISPPSDTSFPLLLSGGGKTHVPTALVMWETPNPTEGKRRYGFTSHINRASNSIPPGNLYLLNRQLHNQWTDGTGRKLGIFSSWL